MGRSISKETSDRINALERLGRRCKMNCCSQKATWAIKEAAWDVRADGSTAAEREPTYMGYCKKHADQHVAATKHYGALIEGDGWSSTEMYRVEVATGGGSKQVQVVHLPAVKLRSDDVIRDGKILPSHASLVAAFRADLDE